MRIILRYVAENIIIIVINITKFFEVYVAPAY